MTGHEKFCLSNAQHFTAVRGRGAQRTRTSHETLADAEARAAEFGDGRTMIYAVTAENYSAHIKNA